MEVNRSKKSVLDKLRCLPAGGAKNAENFLDGMINYLIDISTFLSLKTPWNIKQIYG